MTHHQPHRLPSQKIQDLVQRAFAPGGALAQAMAAAGRRHRHNPVQAEYALAVARGFSESPDRRVTLLEAETGTGKTLGYLVPACLVAALTGRRVAVSTYTLRLQDQILQADLPIALDVAANLVGVRPVAAGRKGMRNFVWPARVEEHLARLEDVLADEGGETATDPAVEMLRRMVEWADSALDGRASGLLSEWLEMEGTFPAGVSADDLCLLPHAPADQAHHYDSHVEEAAAADIIVCNHSLLALDVRFGFQVLSERGENGKPERFGLVVVDEADLLERAAASQFDSAVSLRELARAAQALAAAGISPAEELVDNVEGALKLATEIEGGIPAGDHERVLLLDDAKDAVRGQVDALARQLVRSLTSTADAIRSAKAGGLPRREEYLQVLAHAQATVTAMQSGFLDGPFDERVPVIRWSPVRAYPSFLIRSAQPGRMLRWLWTGENAGADAVVLTSASLAVPSLAGHSFSTFCASVGVPAENGAPRITMASGVFSPRDFGGMEFVIADRAAPLPKLKAADSRSDVGEDSEHLVRTNPEWVAYAARGVQAAAAEGGRVLVLALSWRDTQLISEHLHQLGLQPIPQAPGIDLKVSIDAFRQDPRAIWVTPSAWEGIDLPGLIDHLVITRLPFPPPDAGQQAVYRRVLERRGEGATTIGQRLTSMMINSAKRRLRQGLGRGIRSSEDNVRVWLLDPRFPSPDALVDELGISDAHPRYSSFSACVPERFRTGLNATWPRARIFPV